MTFRALPLTGALLWMMCAAACLLIVPSPVMEQVPNQTVVVGEEFSIDLADYATDPEDRPLTYSVTEGPGAIVDDTTYAYTPAAAEVGAHAVEVAATNGLREARSLFYITVVE
jgi:hypothetical protein